jgi:DNA-binding IscR family transcriptional regulator
VNGPIAMLPCVSLNFYEKCEDCNEDHCGLHDVLIEVRDASLNILEKNFNGSGRLTWSFF